MNQGIFEGLRMIMLIYSQIFDIQYVIILQNSVRSYFLKISSYIHPGKLSIRLQFFFPSGVFVNSAIKTREKDHETLVLHVQKFKDSSACLVNWSPLPYPEVTALWWVRPQQLVGRGVARVQGACIKGIRKLVRNNRKHPNLIWAIRVGHDSEIKKTTGMFFFEKC